MRYPVSKTGRLRPWGFDSLSFRLSFRCSRAVRRATVNREAQVRSLPSELHAPVVERAMTPDSQSGSCGFEPRRGYQPIGGTVEAASHSRHHVRHRDVAVVAPRETPATTRFPEPRDASVTPTSLCPTPRRGSTSRDDFGPFLTPACRGDWPPRRLWAPEIAGSTPAGQTRRSLAAPTKAVPALPARPAFAP